MYVRDRRTGVVKRKVTIRPATLAELEVIVDKMPARLRMLLLRAAWLGLRFGELAELRRADVDLAQHVDPGRDALLFPSFTGRAGEHLSPESLYEHYYPAREAADRSDLRFHDLRHTGATLAAATGGDAGRTDATARPRHRCRRDALPASDRRPRQGHRSCSVRISRSEGGHAATPSERPARPSVRPPGTAARHGYAMRESATPRKRGMSDIERGSPPEPGVYWSR
jgi:hypothetical protein